ncbi:MAG: hypothetical protein IH969_01115 [Candidatus Krumholzibacteriota bacterium]|nr:hypothetical protein [Candidatus Krumholzibacteriota bacterium]
MRWYWLLPFLFATSRTLSLLAHNSGQAQFADALPALLFLISATALAYPVLSWIMRAGDKAALVLSAFWLVCFSYDHFVQFAAVRPRIILLIYLVVISGPAVLLYRTRADLTKLCAVVFIFGLVQFATPLARVAIYSVSQRGAKTVVTFPDEPDLARTDLASDSRPDIYYIILDRYADAGTLRERYGYDNATFLAYLEKRKFFVAGDSRANYICTSQSLASSLNLAYINFLTDAMGTRSNNWLPLFEMMKDYRVWRFLKEEGYEFVHFGPRWAPTTTNPHADKNFYYHRFSEFTTMLWETTMFYPIMHRFGLLDLRREKWERVTRQFEWLSEIPERSDRPVFVFAHFLVPHNPYVFNTDGSFVNGATANERGRDANYLNQLTYVNTLVRELVDKLLDPDSSGTSPIIIIQGDEGTYPLRTTPIDFDWRTATSEEVSQKVRILNAIHAPLAYDSLYDGLTPVNTFRIIFNTYFGTRLARLPDRSYSYRDVEHLYDFFDVTEQINAVRH